MLLFASNYLRCFFPELDPNVERHLLQILADNALLLPINSNELKNRMNALRPKPVNRDVLHYFLQKLFAQSHITLDDSDKEIYQVTMVDHTRVQ